MRARAIISGSFTLMRGLVVRGLVVDPGNPNAGSGFAQVRSVIALNGVSMACSRKRISR